jgi:hypothetical protein
MGAGRIPSKAGPPAGPSVSRQGEVVVAVARTDASPAEIMRSIEDALRRR